MIPNTNPDPHVPIFDPKYQPSPAHNKKPTVDKFRVQGVSFICGVQGVGFICGVFVLIPCSDSQGANASFDLRGHVPASRG